MGPAPAPWPNGDLQNGYEGPRSWFSNVAADFNSGVVNLSPPLAPGESTYFSVEQPNSAVTAVANVPTVSTAIKTKLTGDGQSGTRLIVPQGTPVTDTASVSGASAAAAGGMVNYRVFRDKACTSPVGSPSSVTVTKGAPAPSAPITPPAGTYYLQASYGGDPVNAPSASPCGATVLVVAQRFNAGLPSTKACLRNALQFHARKPKALRSLTLGININNRLAKRVKVAGKRQPLTTIRKLPAGRFRVAAIGIAGNGSAFEDERMYSRCGK
jgi:hypothetical protein